MGWYQVRLIKNVEIQCKADGVDKKSNLIKCSMTGTLITEWGTRIFEAEKRSVNEE